MSIEVAIVGAAGTELEDILRSSHWSITSAGITDLVRLAQPGAKTPRAIVVDLRSRAEIPPALPLLKKEHPEAGVVIVAGKLDPTLMLEAMRAGVTEWVVHPVVPADLVAAVQRAVGGKLGATPAEVFAVMGAKGGVGATTLAVNLATALSAGAKGKTLLIDLHPACGDAALFLGVEPSFTMADALENTHRLDEAFLKGIVMKTAAGPDLLASPERSAAAAVDAGRLSAVVEFASRCYRFVVLDVPRSEPALEKTLGLVKTITVVATQELAAIRSASRIAGALRTRYSAERVRVVVNRYDTAAEIGSEDLERAIGGRIGHTFPSNYRLAIDALNKGRPIVVDNHNKLSAAFASYAKTLSGAVIATADPATTQSAGLLGRFTRRR